MKIENKFTEIMLQKSYAELLEIVGKLRNDYQPQAVIAAEEELHKRIPPETETENTAKKKSEKKAKVDRAKVPLDTNSKIIALLFPRPYRFLIDFELKDEGYLRKYHEWKQWTWIGVAFYFAIFVIIMLVTMLI